MVNLWYYKGFRKHKQQVNDDFCFVFVVKHATKKREKMRRIEEVS